jgi:hypothetical protein
VWGNYSGVHRASKPHREYDIRRKVGKMMMNDIEKAGTQGALFRSHGMRRVYATSP